MADNIFAGMEENPEYQRMMQKLLQTPKAVRALIDPGLADEAYAKELLDKNLLLRRLGEQKAAFEGKLGVEKDKLALEKGLGLSNLQAMYNLRLGAAENANKLAERNNTIGNILGAASVGVSGYGLYNTNKLRSKLPAYYNILIGE